VLATFAYEVESIRVIELLEVFENWSQLPKSPEEDRIETRMDAGDNFRRIVGQTTLVATNRAYVDVTNWKLLDAPNT
jgi:hypothetical protein